MSSTFRRRFASETHKTKISGEKPKWPQQEIVHFLEIRSGSLVLGGFTYKSKQRLKLRRGLEIQFRLWTFRIPTRHRSKISESSSVNPEASTPDRRHGACGRDKLCFFYCCRPACFKFLLLLSLLVWELLLCPAVGALPSAYPDTASTSTFTFNFVPIHYLIRWITIIIVCIRVTSLCGFLHKKKKEK